jgi:Flp pilus assembly protein TadG
MTVSMETKAPRKTAAGERGQAILEMLPIISLLLMMTFAVIDFGRAIWQLEVITGLTREGSNLASRSTSPTPLVDAANAVAGDGVALNLTGTCASIAPQCGLIIVTSVQNTSPDPSAPIFIMTGQYQTGHFSAASKIGTYSTDPDATNQVMMPAETPLVPIPQPGATVYITEIYNTYSPITPLGGFAKYTMASKIYDAAYF